MDFGFSKDEEVFRQEVKDWLRKEAPTSWLEVGPRFWEDSDDAWAMERDFERKAGARGWFIPSFPPEYGGIGATHIQQLIINEEKRSVGVPYINEGHGSFIGNVLMAYGSEEQKKQYLPGIGRGDLTFCLGYSEPGTGSDLASVQTLALADGDDFIISGQKIFTSRAHRADYIFLVTRTDPDAEKHKGISLFLVDLKLPGITIRPLINILGAHYLNEVFFDAVRVSNKNLIGTKNQGWRCLTAALNHERSMIDRPVAVKRVFQEIMRYAKQTSIGNGVLADDPVIQQKLAEMAIQCEVSRLLCYRVVYLQSKGLVPTYEASQAHVFGSELVRKIAKIGEEILGPYGQLTGKSKWVPLTGDIAHLSQASISFGIGGGTMEIQRSLIARLGLGLPRS